MVHIIVAVVGATFAYFTATGAQDQTIEDATGSAATAKVDTVSLSVSPDGQSENVIYPGTENYAGIHVQVSKSGDGTAGADYEVSYKVSAKVSVTPSAFTKGDVTVQAYKSTGKVSSPVSCTPTHSGLEYTDSCTHTGLTQTIGDPVTLTKAEDAEKTLEFTDKLTTKETEDEVYYYLLVTYENSGDDQTDDAGGTKTLKYEFTNVDVTSTDVAAAG